LLVADEQVGGDDQDAQAEDAEERQPGPALVEDADVDLAEGVEGDHRQADDDGPKTAAEDPEHHHAGRRADGVAEDPAEQASRGGQGHGDLRSWAGGAGGPAARAGTGPPWGTPQPLVGDDPHAPFYEANRARDSETLAPSRDPAQSGSPMRMKAAQ